MQERAAVLGAGAWGTAFSMLLADKGIDVSLWCYEADVARGINSTHRNRKYLPGVVLPQCVRATNNLQEALNGATWIFEAIPVRFLRTTLQQIIDQAPESINQGHWVILSKGLEPHTLMLPSQILEQVFGKTIKYTVVSGPNFAAELAQRVFTATTVASSDTVLAERLALLLTTDYFKAYPSPDPIGVQVGGAAKNALALAIGIARGAGFKHKNTVAYLFSQGLDEIAQIVTCLGGKRETVYGLSGLGDMVLTGTSTLSKNFRFGVALGKGMSFQEVQSHFTVLPEGPDTLRSLQQLIERYNLRLPIINGTYQCVFEDASFRDVLGAL